MESRGTRLLLLLLLLTTAAGAVLAAENRKGHEWPSRAESFQNLVGGLGFGSALDLSDCASDFDPRLEESCTMNYGPIAGGAWFSSRQAVSIFFLPPLEHRFRPQAEEGDALPP